MAQISRILRSVEDNRLMFWCPGCKQTHLVGYGDGGGVRWTWNGDVDKPTFTPSILVTWDHGEQYEPRRCHSFVRDGNIQFLGDCTHELAGQTVPLPAWDEGLEWDQQP